MSGQLKNERELLDRLAYHGPVEDYGGGVTKTYTWGAAATEVDVWVPQTGNRFIISNIIISSVGACTVTLFDDDDDESNRIAKVNLAANTVIEIPFPIPRPSSDPNKKLQVTTSATGGDLTVFGWEDGVAVLSTTTTVSTSTSSVSTSSVSQSTSSYSTSSSSITTVSTSSSSHTTSSSSSSSTSSSSLSTSTSSVSTSSHSTSSSSHSITYL